MIVSRENRYIFVQVEHTACSALGRELCALYGGEKILTKHALYDKFLASANQEERKYLSFACLRNPLDVAVTIYVKFKTNHNSQFDDPRFWKRNGGWINDRTLQLFWLVRDKNLSFPKYLRMAYQFPFDNSFSQSLEQVDVVLRYERLEADFAAVLARLGLEQVRPVPVFNATREKAHYLSYYDTPEMRRHAVKIFGPYLQTWGYGIPEGWEDQTVPTWDRMTYRALGVVRRRLLWGSSPAARRIRTLAGR